MSDDFIARISSILGSAYVVERELGAGMSRVVVARDVALGRRVVVKVLPADWAAGLSADRFRREVVMAAALQHPHIVPLLSASEAADGTLYYTMPYVEGDSLRSRLATGTPPLHDSLRWLRDVASALAYAHSRGIVHRDMKPDNILLSGGYALVADFGIAKALTNASATLSGMTAAVGPITTIGSTLGTPAYMAPEQVAAEADADYRADLYALGVIAYELLTGAIPFSGTSQAILVAHLTATPAPLELRREGLPEALRALVMQCLSKDAALRPQSADVIVRELESVLRTTSIPDGVGRFDTPSTSRDAALPGDRSTGAMAPGAIAPGAKAWGRSNRTRLWLGAAAFVAIVATMSIAALLPKAATLLPHRVAVATLRYAGTDLAMIELSRAIAIDISNELATLDSSDVVGRDEVERVEATFGGKEWAPNELAEQLRAGLLITGDVAAIGNDSVRIRVAVVSGADGKIIRSLRDVDVPKAGMRNATELTRERLAGAVAMLSEAEFGAAMLPAGDPPRIASVLRVREGLHLEATLRVADPGEDESLAEIRRFDDAFKADTSFAQARLWFASAALRRLGGELWADSALALVQTQHNRLTAYERALLDALRADASGNHERSVRGWRLACQLAPSWPNRWWLAMKLRDANRPREALAIFDSLGAQNAQFRRSIPGLRHYTGDFSGEYAAIRDEKERAPSTAGSLGFQQALLQSFAAQDSMAQIAQLLQSVSQLPAEPGSSVAYLLLRTSWELGAHAHPKESAAALQQAVAWCARRTPRDLLNDDVVFDCIESYAYAGTVAPLAALAAPSLRARGADVDLPLLGALGVAAAIRGDRTVAEQFAARIETATRADGSHGLGSWLRARIAAATGEPARAIELLEDAFARGANWSQRLDLHRDPAFAALRGNAGFERLRQPQG